MSMRRLSRPLVGFALCLAVGVGVALSGLAGLLPPERLVPPPLPAGWAPLPPNGRVDVALVSSEGLVEGLARVLDGSEVALHRPGALALVDGRVFAVGSASVRGLLRDLAWQDLPIEARAASVDELRQLATPVPATLGWRARSSAYLGLQSARGWLLAYPSFGLGALTSLLLLLVGVGVPLLRGARRVEQVPWELASEATGKLSRDRVRVVLVADAETLAQVRTAIGEEHVIAATEQAFAFSDGWILAVRKGSVFELVSELGWRERPLEISTRTELVGEGHRLSPTSDEGAEDTLDLLEALHVCGPLAHDAPATGAVALSLA